MKAMIFSDLITMRRSLLQLLGIMAVVCCILAFSMETLLPVAACAATMIPVMFVFSVAAYDEANRWESFRLTAPMSRASVVTGRYASLFLVTCLSCAFGMALAFAVSLVASAFGGAGGANELLAALILESNPPVAIASSALLGSVAVFAIGSITLPLIMRFGMTRATRIIPLVVVLFFVTFVGCMTDDGVFLSVTPPFMAQLAATDGGVMLLALAAVAAGIAVYVISACISIRVYKTREL